MYECVVKYKGTGEGDILSIFKKPLKRDQVITFRTDELLKQNIEELCKAEGISASNAINSVLKDYFDSGDVFIGEETSKLGDVIQEPYDYNPKQLERTVKYFQQRIKESLGEAGDEIEEFLPVGIVTAKVRTKHINAFGWILDDSV